MGVAYSALGNRFYAVRYMHLVATRGDLTTQAFLINDLLKSPKRKSTRRKKIPISVELLSFLYHNPSTVDPPDDVATCIWASIPIGFFFFVWIPEIGNLRHRDASFVRENGRRSISILFAKSNRPRWTWRDSNFGVRSLCYFPVRRVIKW